MKVAIVGSAKYGNRSWVERLVDALPGRTQLIVTGMQGPSLWAEEAARVMGLSRPAVYNLPKKPGGGKYETIDFIALSVERNTRLVDDSDLVICFHDGRCANTREIIGIATEAGKPVFIMSDNQSGLCGSGMIESIADWVQQFDGVPDVV